MVRARLKRFSEAIMLLQDSINFSRGELRRPVSERAPTPTQRLRLAESATPCRGELRQQQVSMMEMQLSDHRPTDSATPYTPNQTLDCRRLETLDLFFTLTNLLCA